MELVLATTMRRASFFCCSCRFGVAVEVVTMVPMREAVDGKGHGDGRQPRWEGCSTRSGSSMGLEGAGKVVGGGIACRKVVVDRRGYSESLSLRVT